MSDTLDLGAVTIRNSPDVRTWPATATITRLEFRPTGVHVEHTKRMGPSAWPNFRPTGWDGDLQYTLWIFLNIRGQWCGSGCIQFWQDCDQNGGPPEEFAKNWYYAADRWAPMTGYQPQPGELVGFMVSAGDARNNGIVSVEERSNVVTMPFPSSGAVYLAEAPPAPGPTPEPPPAPHPEPPPAPSPSEVLALLNTIRDEIILTKLQGAETEAKVAALLAKVDTLPDSSQPVTFPEYDGTVSLKIFGTSQTARFLLKPRGPQ